MGSPVASWALSLTITYGRGAVPTARVAHTGLPVASWALSLAITYGRGAVLTARVAYTGVLMEIVESVGMDMSIAATDLHVSRSHHEQVWSHH